MRVEKDEIWTRSGVPIEELPDPLGQETAFPQSPETSERPAGQRRWPLVL